MSAAATRDSSDAARDLYPLKSVLGRSRYRREGKTHSNETIRILGVLYFCLGLFGGVTPFKLKREHRQPAIA